MKIMRVCAIFFLFAVFSAAAALAAPPLPAAAGALKPPSVAQRQPPPRKPAKIKLHRTAKGEHTWDISGDNVQEIVTIDRRLQKALETQEAAGEKAPAGR